MLLHQTYLKPWITQNTSYFGILRYIQAYLGIALTYLGIFVTVCNLGIFRTLAFSEPCQTSTMQCFAKMFKCIRIYQLPFINVSATRYQLYLNLATFCISYPQMYHFTTTYSVIYPLISQLLLISVSTTPKVLQKAVARRCSVNKVLLKILQSSRESTCAKVSFLIKLQSQALLLVTLLTHI